MKQLQIDKTKVRLLYIRSDRYEGDWHSTAHTHHSTELFYVTHGEGSFLVEGKSFPVKEDDLVIVNPNIKHTEVSTGTRPLEYIVVGIEDLTFSSDTDDPKDNYNLYNYHNYKDEILFYLKALLKEFDNKEANHELVCQNLLEVLIINIIRRTSYGLSVTSPVKMSKECAFVKRYIDGNFKSNITLDLLSELTHMNKYYLVHTFKNQLGISPINYLIQKRISESRVLLETTDYSIGQISEILGFSSQSYFSQSFRNNMAQTPNDYRKSVKLE